MTVVSTDENAAPAPARSRENTRARLLGAAVDVFAEKGLHGTTVDDIAGAAGFTRGAFYSNFATKEDVFYALFEAQSELMVSLVHEVVGSPDVDTLDGGLVGAVLERLRPHARTWYLLQAEFRLHAIRDTDAGRLYLAQRTRFDREFADAVRIALARIDRKPTVPVEVVAEIVSSLYLSSLAAEAGAAPDDALASRTLVAQTLPTVVLGLSAPRDDA